MSLLHVWLVHPTAARGEAGLIERIRLQLLGRRPAGGPLGWLARLVAWWTGRGAVRALLPLTSKPEDTAGELGLLLGRRLGPRYRCRALVEPDALERALASLGRGERVVVVPMGLTATSAPLAEAVGRVEAALAKHPTWTRVPGLAGDAEVVEACCEPVREALIAARGDGAYGVLFVAGATSDATAEHGRQVEGLVAGLRERLGSRAPQTFAWSPAGAWPLGRRPGLVEAVGTLRSAGVSRVLVVCLDDLRGDPVLRGELEGAAHRALGPGTPFRLAPAVGARPTLVAALAELVRRAELDAGWRGPEGD